MQKNQGYTLEGLWQADIGDGKVYGMSLPGTLDENGIGHKDTGSNQWHPDAELGNAEEGFAEDAPIATRFTRRVTFEGEARLTRKVALEVPTGKRVFLEAERARCLKLLVDGKEVQDFVAPSISTPHVFEVTQVLGEVTQENGKRTGECVEEKEGAEGFREHELILLSDNSYPGLPHDAIVYSSAATDETQTNWNGVLGYLRLRVEEPVFIENVRVYPMKDTVTVKVDVCADRPWSGKITLKSEALKETAMKQVNVKNVKEVTVDLKKVNMQACEGQTTEGQTTEGQTTEKQTLNELTSGKSESLRTEIVFESLALCDDIQRWDEYEGNLYEMTAILEVKNPEQKMYSKCITGAEDAETGDTGGSGTEAIDTKTVTFGIRDFGDNGEGRFALNGRTIFVRSETNCAEFPEAGYSPVTVAEWMNILQQYKDYGINLVRFHSHCPAEAAFVAADELGMLLQPELSHWNPKDAFESEESYEYYKTEIMAIIRMLANHPSFVMLTLGNELHASQKGHERMQELLKLAREYDATRLYADGSNVHYGAIGCDAGSDFYASQKYFEEDLRGAYANMEGYINQCYPNAMTNYDKIMESIWETYKKPVFSFEVGQFEVLPDFDELEDFQGISDPVNFKIIQEKVKERGLLPVWKKYVEATGELSRIGYREEIEAAMRTKDLSGISLLGLQDFPGQGTALVGMLNSHLQPKPFDFAKPERFREFFREQLPLALLSKYTYENTETLQANVQIANFGKTDISGCLEYVLQGDGVHISGKITGENGGEILCPAGELTDVKYQHSASGQVIQETECNTAAKDVRRNADLQHNTDLQHNANAQTDNYTLTIPLKTITHPTRLNLTVSIANIKNTYPIWVYPKATPTCPDNIYETEHFDERTKQALAEGKTVYLTPPSIKEALPNSIQAQFTTDFWSVGTFAGQEGGMGQLIDEKHPVFKDFPTEFHTNWQWWPMASQRAVILPKQYDCIITEMDSYAYLRPMAQLLECKCGNGKVLFSTLGLQDLQQYPEARALLSSIYRYLDSEEFQPVQEIEAEVFENLVK